MTDIHSRNRAHNRAHHFQPISLAERLSEMLQTDGANLPDEQAHVNLQNPAAQQLLEDDESNLGTSQIEDRLIEYEGEVHSYTRLLVALIAAVMISCAILLPTLLLQATCWCGNGVIELVELCDDANRNESDGCKSNCTITPGFQCTAGNDGRFLAQLESLCIRIEGEVAHFAAHASSPMTSAITRPGRRTAGSSAWRPGPPGRAAAHF